MKKRNIIVIGASAGGFEALKILVSDLPADFDASIFIVWHMSPDLRGVLPDVLNRSGPVPAANAKDKEPILTNRIYVAPPDHHLLVEESWVRTTKGPRENRFRPAVDPLFRSAAYTFGARVIGVVLSGALDDGTSGLWTIKRYGGIAIVQDPEDAAVAAMPQNALKKVDVDHQVPIAGLAALLVQLSAEEVPDIHKRISDDERIEQEIRIAMLDDKLKSDAGQFGQLTPYACPECHGVLSSFKEGEHIRFRCHTGHAYSSDSLLTTLTEKIEDSLWNAIRGMEETVFLLNHLGDHFSEANRPKLAAGYFRKAAEAEQRIRLIKDAINKQEQLSTDGIEHGEVHTES